MLATRPPNDLPPMNSFWPLGARAGNGLDHRRVFGCENFGFWRRPLFAAVAARRHVGEFKTGYRNVVTSESCGNRFKKGKSYPRPGAVGDNDAVGRIFGAVVEDVGHGLRVVTYFAALGSGALEEAEMIEKERLFCLKALSERDVAVWCFRQLCLRLLALIELFRPRRRLT